MDTSSYQQEKDILLEHADDLLHSHIAYLCTCFSQEKVILTTLQLCDLDLDAFLHFFHYRETTFWIAPHNADILHKIRETVCDNAQAN